MSLTLRQIGLIILCSVVLYLIYGGTRSTVSELAHQKRVQLQNEIQSVNVSEFVSEGAHRFFVEVVCWNPRIAVIHDFLTPEECEHLIELGADRVAPSLLELDGDQVVERSQRSSSGAFLERGEDEIVRRIEQRIAAATLIPPSNGESLYILNYKQGQHYDYHFDYFDMENEESRMVADAQGGQRVATMLIYLSDVEMGGDTHFPDTDGCGEDGESGVWVKPKRGKAVWWYNTHPGGAVNERSKHAGLPVVMGEKWSATRWLREKNAENS